MPTANARTYCTSDMLRAAYLYSCGRNLSHTTKDGSRTVFHFDESQICEALVHELDHGDDRIGARAFYRAERLLKRVIHRDKGDGHAREEGQESVGKEAVEQQAEA